LGSAQALLTKGSTSQGLAFMALSAFLVSFFAARIFTTINPDVVVVSSGIHFHHFWYGLVMVCVAGWLGIASTRPEFDRIYALVFGLGLGLIGDETGLLLTLGDYHSELTYVVFLGGLAIAGLVYLTLRYDRIIRDEVLLLGKGERTVHLGVGLVAMSFLAFAFNHNTTGAVVAAVGLGMVITGAWLHTKRRREQSPESTAPDEELRHFLQSAKDVVGLLCLQPSDLNRSSGECD
jgi:hypothetical protein